MSVDYFRKETFESVSDSVTWGGGGDGESILPNSTFDDQDGKGDGNGDESNSDNEEQDSERKEQDTTESILSYKQLYLGRLRRRTQLISEIRKAYLRDIVLLKHFLSEYLTHDDRHSILQQWEKSIPSLDLRQHFMIYSPHESSLDVIPCETCGGSVEIVHHDSSEIQELSKALSHLDKNKNELRVLIAKKNLIIENYEINNEINERKHKEEVSQSVRTPGERSRERTGEEEGWSDYLSFSDLTLLFFFFFFFFVVLEKISLLTNERFTS